jgi:hypothetical protein
VWQIRLDGRRKNWREISFYPQYNQRHYTSQVIIHFNRLRIRLAGDIFQLAFQQKRLNLHKKGDSIMHPLFLILALLTASEGSMDAIQLPQQIGLWSRPDSAQTVTARTIFDYMDGAGELYLGYRFDRLEVLEYTAEDEYSILVEIYYMQTSDDAYGLLSLDWDGERIEFKPERNDSSPVAFYGAGLLRMWAGPVYVRVMAYNETDLAREAVLQLGQRIAEQCPAARPPALTHVSLPLQSEPPPHYFRSYLVLNSLYFLASRNILNLDSSVEGLFAGRDGCKVLLLHYPDETRAGDAAQLFLQSYLPDQPCRPGEFFKIESGYLACFQSGAYLTIILDCPTPEEGHSIARQIAENMKTGGLL